MDTMLAQPTPPAPPASSRLLVVDDEDDVRAVMRELLTEEGYTVEVAATLEEALALHDERLFDLTLTDLLNHDPARLLQGAYALVERSQPAPVAIFSGWPLIPVQVREAGFAALIAKPFELEGVLATVAHLLDIRLTPTQQDERETMERYCAAFNAHDLDACLALCADDLRFTPPDGFLAGAHEIKGRAAYRAHLEAGLRLMPDFRFEARRYYPQGSRDDGITLRFEESWRLPDALPGAPGGQGRLTANMCVRFHDGLICAMAATTPPTRLEALLAPVAPPNNAGCGPTL